MDKDMNLIVIKMTDYACKMASQGYSKEDVESRLNYAVQSVLHQL